MLTEQFSQKEILLNEQAIEDLIPGKYYNFKPAVEATGIPTGGPGVCAPQMLNFKRGWYMGYSNGNHVFQEKPVDDPRNIDKRLRQCYFHVAFIGGSKCEVDQNQRH